MKKVIAIILILAMVFAFSACGYNKHMIQVKIDRITYLTHSSNVILEMR